MDSLILVVAIVGYLFGFYSTLIQGNNAIISLDQKRLRGRPPHPLHAAATEFFYGNRVRRKLTAVFWPVAMIGGIIYAFYAIPRIARDNKSGTRPGN